MSDRVFVLQIPAIFLHQLQAGDVVLGIALSLVALSILSRSLVWTRRVSLRSGVDIAGRMGWQLGALLGLEQGYEYTRGQIPQNIDVAYLHAYRLLDLEWRHGFFIEERLQRFFQHYHLLMGAIDLFYVISHAVVTIGVLAWIYLQRREHYGFVRNLFIVTTGIALVAFYLYPTAPPRMLSNYGFFDPLQTNHLASEGGAQPGSYTYNPYAAMPSLHVGYALVVSWGLLRAARSILVRCLALLYPAAMAAAVVISGNHWLLDVAGAVATVVLARVVLLAGSRLWVFAGTTSQRRVSGT